MNMRIGLKLISVFLASILWIYVNLIISPEVRRVVIAPVEYKNLPPLIKVTPQKSESRIQLRGTRRDFIFAGRDSVQVTVDLYNLRPGTAMFPLKVTAPSGLRVEGMKPAQIEISGETLIRREFDVSVEVRGQTAEGFLADSPVVNPRRVTVEGPKDMIDKITSCQVFLTLLDAKNSVSEAREVSVFTIDGPVKNNIKVTPDKVDVVITVKSGYPSKVVSITPQFINKPPEGFKLEGYTVDPSSITVSGPLRVLEQIGDIRTLPIDLSAIEKSSIVQGALNSQITNAHFMGSSTVSISIELGVTKIIRNYPGLPLSLKNSSNQHCIAIPSSYTLVLKGFSENLAKVSPADLAVVLDVRKMTPGSYSVPLPCPVGMPDKVEILEIQPPKVNVEISEISVSSDSSSIRVQ